MGFLVSTCSRNTFPRQVWLAKMSVSLDIRSKILLVLFTNFLLIVRVSLLMEGLVVLVLAGIFMGSGFLRRGLIFLGVFLAFLIFELIFLETLPSFLSLLGLFLVGGRLMLPCFMAGSYLLQTTSVHAFIHGLRKWHVPESLLLSLAVMVRFLPSIPQDYAHIRQSLRLRGLFLKPWSWLSQPVSYFEMVMVPLLMAMTRTAQDLTVATLTKSIARSGSKTSYISYALGWQDYLLYGLLGTMTLLISLGVGR